MKEDQEKILWDDVDPRIKGIIQGIGVYVIIFLIIILSLNVVYLFVVIPFLIDFFREQNITNYHGFGIFYQETETGMSFGYNLLELDILFLIILTTFIFTICIWFLWYLKKTKANHM